MRKNLPSFILILMLLGIYQYSWSQSNFKVQIGKIDSLYSNILQESREIYIQLPESFNPDSDTKYPVTYILDGDVMLNELHTVHSYYSGGFMP